MRSPTSFLPQIALSLLLLFDCSRTQIAVARSGFCTRVICEIESLSAVPAPTRSEVLADLAMQVAATENNAKLALELFDRAVQVAETIQDRSQKITTMSAVAVKLAEAGFKSRSLQLFNRAEQLTRQGDRNFQLYYKDEALRDIAIQLARSGQTSPALQLTQKIVSNYRKAEALNEIAPILAKAGQLKQAKQTLLDALKFARNITGDYAYEANGSCGNNKYDVLSKIAGNLSLLAQFDRAIQVAQTVTGCSSGIGESGEDYQAWAFLGILSHLANVNQVKQTWVSAQKIQNNIEKAPVWSAIAVKLVSMGETNFALSVAALIADKIPSVTKIDSGSALREYGVKEKAQRDIAVKLAEVGQFAAAKQVAEMIHELTEPEKAAMGEFNLSIQPSQKALTLVDIAQLLAKAGKVEQALQVAESISNVEGKGRATIAIARELQKTGQETQAQKLLSQNLQLPPIPNANDFNANESMRRIAVALVTVGQVEQAREIAQSLKYEIGKEETLADIAAQLAEIGQVERGLQLANSLKPGGFKEEALRKIASKFLEKQQVEQALQVANTLDRGNDKDEILAGIADSFAKLRQTQRSLQVAQTIADDEIKVSAIGNIAAQLMSTR